MCADPFVQTKSPERRSSSTWSPHQAPLPTCRFWQSSGQGQGRPTSQPHSSIPDRKWSTGETRPFLNSRFLPWSFPQNLPCRRWRGSTICCPFMGTPALEKLWQACKCSHWSLFTLSFVSAILYLCTYTEFHICSASLSESQVDDYSIFIYKEPSAF